MLCVAQHFRNKLMNFTDYVISVELHFINCSHCVGKSFIVSFPLFALRLVYMLLSCYKEDKINGYKDLVLLLMPA